MFYEVNRDRDGIVLILPKQYILKNRRKKRRIKASVHKILTIIRGTISWILVK